MKPRRQLQTVQPSLFEPPPASPQWETLSGEIRQAVVPLQAHLLCEHPLPQNDVDDAREVADE